MVVGERRRELIHEAQIVRVGGLGSEVLTRRKLCPALEHWGLGQVVGLPERAWPEAARPAAAEAQAIVEACSDRLLAARRPRVQPCQALEEQRPGVVARPRDEGAERGAARGHADPEP